MTGRREHLPPDDEADLAALADGALYGPRRADLEQRLTTEPALAEALEHQREAVAMIAAALVPAPPGLRARIEELQAAPRRPRRRRLLPAAVLAFAATAAAVVVLLAGRGPAVEDLLAVALRPATAPAGTTEAFEGVRFPRYENWDATGTRTDVIDGRRVRTVFYERDGRTIAYAIVAGPALADDGELRAVRDGDQVAVTWTRDGRTCLIVADGADPKALAKLAVW
jgi:anti-sigma factor RsiW